MAESFANLRGAVWLVLLTGLLVGSCAGIDAARELHATDDPYGGSDYLAAYQTWTRETRIYRGLDLELSAAATLASASFRKAYDAEYTRHYRSESARQKAASADAPASRPAFVDFVLAVYVPDKKGNDLDQADSIWQLYLTRGDSLHATADRVLPTEIRRVKKLDARWYHFYPSISPWQAVYEVRFAMSADMRKSGIQATTPTNRYTLVITGVRGSASMHWGPVKN